LGAVKGEIYMLPEIDEWIPETTWHPAELVEYDPLRRTPNRSFDLPRTISVNKTSPFHFDILARTCSYRHG
jgi:hypothetical protein